MSTTTVVNPNAFTMEKTIVPEFDEKPAGMTAFCDEGEISPRGLEILKILNEIFNSLGPSVSGGRADCTDYSRAGNL